MLQHLGEILLITSCIKKQLGVCYRLITCKGLESNNAYDNYEYVEYVCLCHDYISFKLILPSDFNNACLIMKWVEIHGQIYRKGIYIVIYKGEHYYDSLFIFGLIKSVLQ